MCIKTKTCSLCEKETRIFINIRNKEYNRCPNCHAIQMNPQHYLKSDEEKTRYETHNNDVFDLGYQQFVSPIVDAVLLMYNTSHKGFDFGSGTGPVIKKILREKGYDIKVYDPYFSNNENVLQDKYDYIVICEVVEHFHSPKVEFELLKSLLKDGGSLFIMTELYDETKNFETWYYKNDPTHVFFYHKITMKWIKDNYQFSNYSINHRLIQFNL